MKQNALRGSRTVVCLLAAVCLPAIGSQRKPPDVLWREMSREPGHAAEERARRRNAEYEARRQLELIDAFVKAWNNFIGEWSERGTFNVRKAKAVRKAWDRLEKEDLWPR